MVASDIRINSFGDIGGRIIRGQGKVRGAGLVMLVVLVGSIIMSFASREPEYRTKCRHRGKGGCEVFCRIHGLIITGCD